MPVTWFPDAPPFPGTPNWEVSTNSGGTYAPYAGGSFAEPINGIDEQQRFRRVFTVPAGMTSDLVVTFSGDLHDGDNNLPAKVYIDGVLIDYMLPLFGPAPTQIPNVYLTPGVHTLELRLAATGSVAGSTSMTSATAALVANSVIPVPECSCNSLVWTPAVASSSSGWTKTGGGVGTPGTVHVSANVAAPNFTINGPIRGLRYRSPDLGGPGYADGDGAVVTNINTNETAATIRPNAAGWVPAVPAFPATAAGPFVNTFNGITVTVNREYSITLVLEGHWLVGI